MGITVPISQAQQKAMFKETYEATKRLILETYPNIGGSSDAEVESLIDTKIATAISLLIGGATEQGNTLKELEDRLGLSENNVDTKIATAISLLKGENLPESQDTLKELADMIIANSNGVNETAVQALIDASISALIGGATEQGDTLKELEDRLGGSYPLATLEELDNVDASEPPPSTPPLTRAQLDALISDWNDDQSNVDKQNAIINANVSEITDMHNLFRDKTDFNLDISGWNTSNVTNMEYMFLHATNFNQNINNWDVSNVTKMHSMFTYATNFNQPIGSWNVSNVTDMFKMFGEATSFNQPLNNWNTSNVTDMYSVFNGATSFNQNISNWNVSNVITMEYMFYNTTNFNQNISNWNVSSVTDMRYMFENATNFNQNISSWNVDNVTKWDHFKYYSALTDAHTPSKFL